MSTCAQCHRHVEAIAELVVCVDCVDDWATELARASDSPPDTERAGAGYRSAIAASRVSS